MSEYLCMGVFQAIVTALVTPIIWYFMPYFKEKGKNLATREDIEELTRLVESVKTEHAKKLAAHTVRFEKEFKALEEIWEKLLKLRNTAMKLRPPGESYANEERTKDEEKKNGSMNIVKPSTLSGPYFIPINPLCPLISLQLLKTCSRSYGLKPQLSINAYCLKLIRRTTLLVGMKHRQISS